jgi:hypothetical protein
LAAGFATPFVAGFAAAFVAGLAAVVDFTAAFAVLVAAFVPDFAAVAFTAAFAAVAFAFAAGLAAVFAAGFWVVAKGLSLRMLLWLGG